MMLISRKFESFFELLSPEYAQKYDKIRYVILIGGRGGAKSHALGTWVNAASYLPGWGILSTRWTMKSAEKSIIPEFHKLSTSLGNASDFLSNRSQVINKQTDVVVDYSGLKPQSNQSSGALKSLSNKNIFIVEEAEDVQNFEIFDKVDNSIRTIDQKNLVILCLNQGSINHWIYTEFIKESRDDTMVIEMTYLDNLKYLDAGFVRKAERLKERDYKRYRHIYLNDWKKDTDGALWKQIDIDSGRISREEFTDSVDVIETVIAYDPSVTDTKPGEQRKDEPDEDGIIVASKDVNKRVFMREDHSCRGTRIDIARKLVELYYQHNASYVVIEKNNGGDFIPALIHTVDPYVRCKTVTATKGKALRAAPIQARYEAGDIHHVGYLTELEYEQTTWVPDSGMSSPNRIDACVWAGTYFLDDSELTTIDL